MQVVIRHNQSDGVQYYLCHIVCVDKEFPQIHNKKNQTEYQSQVRLFVGAYNTDKSCEDFKDMKTVKNYQRKQSLICKTFVDNIGKVSCSSPFFPGR